MAKRGATEQEVLEAITNSSWQPARQGRFEATKAFEFNAYWNNNYYGRKQVIPVFVEEKDRIVVITVYTLYF